MNDEEVSGLGKSNERKNGCLHGDELGIDEREDPPGTSETSDGVPSFLD